MVFGLGLVNLDILMMLDREIEFKSKNLVKEQLFQLGGVVPTALIVLSRLGVPCQIHTVVADDHHGKMLLEILQKEKVDTSFVKVVEDQKTPISIVVVDGYTGERTILYTRGIYPSVDPEIFTIKFHKNSKLLITDGHNAKATSKYIDLAHKNKVKTILDLGNPKQGKEELIAKTDIVIVPKAYWKTLWPEVSPDEIAMNLQKQGPRTVVVTIGEKGCVVADNDQVFHQPGFRVKAVDTNGAGDIFIGAFAYGILKSWSIRKTTEFASAIAAMSCTKIGKDEKIPRSEEKILLFIKSYSRNY